MRQLVLDIRRDAPQTLESFVVGENPELLAALACLARGETLQGTTPQRLYLWGEAHSGRSHLLAGACAAAQAQGHDTLILRGEERALHDRLRSRHDALILVDDVERLDAAGQIALFNLINRAPQDGLRLVFSGPCPPRDLRLREDLRTRIGQSLIFQVRPLDEAQRAVVLAAEAARRGLRLDDDTIAFVLRHGRRDLVSLLGVLDALDAASLELKRPLTLPLLRSLMQQGLDLG